MYTLILELCENIVSIKKESLLALIKVQHLKSYTIIDPIG